MIKNIYEKPRSNILFNGERLKAFLPPKMSLSGLSFNCNGGEGQILLNHKYSSEINAYVNIYFRAVLMKMKL